LAIALCTSTAGVLGGQAFVPMQGDAIHYAGQHVALVVAETLEQARYAASLVAIEYEAAEPVATLADGLDRAFVPPPGPFGPNELMVGDPDGALAAAEVKVEATYSTPTHHHNPMEPSATVAVWEGDRLTLYDATQGVSLTQIAVATMLGVGPDKVRVVAPYLGGGFGCKGFAWPHSALAAAAARLVGRPVKLVLTRAQGYTSHGHRAECAQTLRLAASASGELRAIEHVATSQASTLEAAANNSIEGSQILYACPNVRTTQRLAQLDFGIATPMRSPAGPGMFALESALDELSYALGLDPIELRLRNHGELNPFTGQPWGEGKRLKECYADAAARFGWRERPPPRSMAEGSKLVGWGMASAFHPYYFSPAAAAVRVSVDGQAFVRSGTQDIGTGTYTVMTQVAADALGLSPGAVRFDLGDSALPPAPFSAGSATVASVTDAVHRACSAARAEVVAFAVADPRSPLFGAAPEQIGAEDGTLFVTGEPGRAETYRQILARRGKAVEAQGDNGVQGFGAGYSYGAVFAEVRVDRDLGEVRVSRLVAAFDAGRILNHKTARSQAFGGLIWGLGMALTEHTIVDRNLGRIVTPNLSTYLVPVEADVPDLDVAFIDRPDPSGLALGARGLGEVTGTGASAAIANAVYHATGRRVRDLPITPDKLL
jgi:xanthine dehydrogenase YagR molybdenum-binding subunit